MIERFSHLIRLALLDCSGHQKYVLTSGRFRRPNQNLTPAVNRQPGSRRNTRRASFSVRFDLFSISEQVSHGRDGYILCFTENQFSNF